MSKQFIGILIAVVLGLVAVFWFTGNHDKGKSGSGTSSAQAIEPTAAVPAIVPDAAPAVDSKKTSPEENAAEVSSLFAVLDPKNNSKVFSVGSKPEVISNQLGWYFHYQLKNPSAPKEAAFAGHTIVTDGETPGHFAEWCRISTPQFRRLNNLKFGEGIVLGQKVKLECLVSQEKFHQSRLAYHQHLQEDFMKGCPSVQTKPHTTKAAENLWDLSNNQYHTPIWLIQKHNPSRDLTKTLVAGVTLSIPICAQVANGQATGPGP